MEKRLKKMTVRSVRSVGPIGLVRLGLVKRVPQVAGLVVCLVVCLMMAITSFAGSLTPTKLNTAYAEETGSYKFEISAYDVTYDISSDRTMHVQEDITIHYLGYSSTGILRDIPVNAGDRVSNVLAYELVNGNQTAVDYKVEMEVSDYITVDIGDTSIKTNTTHTYRVTYDYATTAKEGANLLSINPIGFGWNAKIENVTITLKLPQGLILSNMVVYVQKKGQTDLYQQTYSLGGTTFTIKRKGSDEPKDYSFSYADNTLTMKYDGVLNDSVTTNEGITFDLPFEDGVLSSNVNFMPYLFLLGGIVVLAVILLLKMFVFNKDKLTPVVNITAPNDMDPLMMGKLIDNKVNNEDITSLIYYWANKGYLKINLDNPNNPQLIRIMQTLPQDTPSYQLTMYYGLFRGGDVVKINSLRNNFYTIVDQVKADVNNRTRKLFDKKSVILSLVMTVICCLVVGLAPFIYGKLAIHSSFSYILSLSIAIPGFILYALTELVMYNRLKITKTKFGLFVAGLVVLAVMSVVVYTASIPAAVFPRAATAILTVLGLAGIMLSISLINRTETYTNQLNDIIGFRNFILYAEKDRLEAMLEDDPDFYYNILPYAQVLNVTDKWEEKFASITMEPPRWLAGNTLHTYAGIHMLSHTMRVSNACMARTMVSRPSSSGLSGGGGHGGSFGGFGGGGHGGGGGRGR